MTSTSFPRYAGEGHAVELYHVVRVRHGSTGAPVTTIDAELEEPAWAHWILRVRGGDVLLAAEDRYVGGRPEATTLRLSISRPALRELYADDGTTEVTLARDDAETTVELAPAEMRVVIELVDRDGDPEDGRSVELRDTAGETVELTEVDDSGIYQSALRTWGPTFRTLQVRVNNRQLEREVAIDYGSTETRVRLLNH